MGPFLRDLVRFRTLLVVVLDSFGGHLVFLGVIFYHLEVMLDLFASFASIMESFWNIMELLGPFGGHLGVNCAHWESF